MEISYALNAWVNNIDQNIVNSLITVDWMLLDLQREQMKSRQVDRFDNPITPPYSPTWAKIKGLTNPNLLDTGSFQRKLVFSATSKKYTIKSTDKKNEKLTKKYGENIFGIAQSNQAKAYSITNHAIGSSIKSATGLT